MCWGGTSSHLTSHVAKTIAFWPVFAYSDDVDEFRPTEPVLPPDDQPTSPAQPVVLKDSSTTPENPTVTSDATPSSKRSDIKNTIVSVLILLMAPVIALMLTLFVFQSYQVDGPSMETTLQNNDRLIVWKLPRTWARISHHQYVPNRGDIIIFTEPGLGNYEEPDGSKQLVKRVIGLPGDQVVVKDGVVTIYNSEHPTGFQPDKTMPYGAGGHIPVTENDGTFMLSSNQLFVCGDNRPNSLDSRIFGPITTDQVVGKLVARILPLSNAEAF